MFHSYPRARHRRGLDALSRLADAALKITDHVPTPLAWRSWRARTTGRSFDRRYGTDTQAHVEVGNLGVDQRVAAHAVWYEPSAVPKALCALRHLGVRHEEYDFIDIGSGKGLVPLLAARYPFRRVVGIEASAALHRIASSNLERYEDQVCLRAPVSFVNADALSYEFDESNHVIYLYNPFDDVLFERFVDGLLQVPPAVRLVLAYVNPVHRSVIERTGAFLVRFDNGSSVVFCRRV